MERALQWWYNQQSRQLTKEAAQIRDCLLQESCAMRRSLELYRVKHDNLSLNSNHNWIERFEIFHTYLQELSDRLSPPYLEEGLPLAIKYLEQKWQIAQPDYEFQLQFTPQWQQQLPDCDRLILTTIDELLKLEVANCVKKAFILINLQQNEQDNQLKIVISHFKSDSVISSAKSRNLEYLSQSFRVLTSGTWITRTQKAKTTYCLKWSRKSN
ncbi:MAG: hypothetical protein RLZZ381_26 [Cyanobacteriota bacterium]|jgi:hypothetical protein